jgi:hypothetical protein
MPHAGYPVSRRRSRRERNPLANFEDPALAAGVLAIGTRQPAKQLDRCRRLGAHRQQLRDVGRIVLAVAVERSRSIRRARP